MSRYSQAVRLIKADFYRYASLSKQGKWRTFISLLVHDSGFKFLIWFRLTAAKGPLFLFNWLMYMHYSRKYHIILPYHTKVGGGIYLGHGMCIVVNPTATIGNNVSISQFVNIGSNKGHAAVIEDGVYLAPHVCLVENVRIGSNSVIGAGAVVTKDIPPFSVAVGVPAKVVKSVRKKCS